MASRAQKTLLEQVRGNSRRAALEALRDKIARTIDSTESGRDIAALSKRLMEVMAEIDGLPDGGGARSPLARAKMGGARQ